MNRCIVGLLADPGLPSAIARDLVDLLPEHLGREVDGSVEWTVHSTQEPFEVAPDAERVIDKARRRVQGSRWDVAVCLTDIPLLSGSGVVVADISTSDRVALVSLPALGGLRLRTRTRDIVVAVVAELVGNATVPVPGPYAQRAIPSTDDIDGELVMRPGRGHARLLAGIVRTNQPWQLTLGLSTALAAAATGSVFGIIYSNVWALAVAMQPWRLVAATAGALAIFVVWLVVGHDLWDRQPRARRLVRLANTGTVLTVVCGVLLFYVTLVVLNLAAAATLLPPDHVTATLGRPAGPVEFLRIALMASVLGLVAGAVGSGLEDDATVRRVAYSTREQQRRGQFRGVSV
ncbi:hypothetical protein [Pseudonocardia sp. DLS-67]